MQTNDPWDDRAPSPRKGETNRVEEKRQRILEGAIRAFAASGFHRTRVSDVAKAAGVADGTIYLYFEGKDDLLSQIFRSSLERFWRRGEGYVLAGETAVEQLSRLVELHLGFMGEDRDLATVLQVDLRHSTQFLGDVSRQVFRPHMEKIGAIIARGQRHGEFANDIPAPEAAKMVLGTLDQMVTAWVLSRRNYRVEALAPETTRFLLRALGARGSGS